MIKKTNHGTPLDLIEENKRPCPDGSGAMTCCGGREAGDQQGSAEGRSREDWRVAPGEARSEGRSQESWPQFLSRLAMALDRECSKTRWWEFKVKWGLEVAAASLRKAVEIRMSQSEEPDSEAPKERSGRRNA